MEKFAILHQCEGTQFLVHTHYHHDTDEFILTYKFWSQKINGFISATITWDSEHEEDMIKMFNKFKSKSYCTIFMIGTETKLLTSEIETVEDKDGMVVKASYEEKLK